MDETEVQALQAALRTLHRRLRQSVPPIGGVSRSAVRALGAVARSENEHGAQPGVIATELGMTTSNVAAALRELEAAGFVVRRRATDDARRIAVVLTDAGEAAVTTHRALRVDGLRDAIEAALTADEQTALAAVIPLLGRVVIAMDGGRP